MNELMGQWLELVQQNEFSAAVKSSFKRAFMFSLFLISPRE